MFAAKHPYNWSSNTKSAFGIYLYKTNTNLVLLIIGTKTKSPQSINYKANMLLSYT
jgi:hypothetical protein